MIILDVLPENCFFLTFALLASTWLLLFLRDRGVSQFERRYITTTTVCRSKRFALVPPRNVNVCLCAFRATVVLHGCRYSVKCSPVCGRGV